MPIANSMAGPIPFLPSLSKRWLKMISDQLGNDVRSFWHHMDVVMELCSQIKVIDFGQTIAEGTPDDIRTNQAVITAYLGDDNI